MINSRTHTRNFMATLIGAFLCCQSAMASVGGKEGGGGDADSIEFKTIAGQISDLLQTDNVAPSTVNVGQFANVVSGLKVVTVSRAYLKGSEVDAINYPSEKKIELSRERWADYRQEPQKKLNLVFHEIVSLMEINDTNYDVSREFIARARNSRAVDVVLASYLNNNQFVEDRSGQTELDEMGSTALIKILRALGLWSGQVYSKVTVGSVVAPGFPFYTEVFTGTTLAGSTSGINNSTLSGLSEFLSMSLRRAGGSVSPPKPGSNGDVSVTNVRCDFASGTCVINAGITEPLSKAIFTCGGSEGAERLMQFISDDKVIFHVAIGDGGDYGIRSYRVEGQTLYISSPSGESAWTFSPSRSMLTHVRPGGPQNSDVCVKSNVKSIIPTRVWTRGQAGQPLISFAGGQFEIDADLKIRSTLGFYSRNSGGYLPMTAPHAFSLIKPNELMTTLYTKAPNGCGLTIYVTLKLDTVGTAKLEFRGPSDLYVDGSGQCYQLTDEVIYSFWIGDPSKSN